MSPIRAGLPQRFVEIGRLRLGDVNDEGRPVRLSTWRLTSPHRAAIERAAELWGGRAEPWADAPGEAAQYQVTVETSTLEVLVPPQNVGDEQYFEAWTAGGIQRRCDGLIELRNGEACLCAAELASGERSERICDITTTLKVVLPKLPGLGVWRCVTRGYYAATELPQTVELLTELGVSTGRLPQAVLGIEVRTRKTNGETHHFPVPVLGLDQSLEELQASGEGALVGATPAAAPALEASGSTAPEIASREAGGEDEADSGPAPEAEPSAPADAEEGAGPSSPGPAATGPVPDHPHTYTTEQEALDRRGYPEGWEVCTFSGCLAARSRRSARKKRGSS